MVAGDGLWGQWRGRRGAVARATGGGDAGDGHSCGRAVLQQTRAFLASPSLASWLPPWLPTALTRVSHTYTRLNILPMHVHGSTPFAGVVGRCVQWSARLCRTYTVPRRHVATFSHPVARATATASPPVAVATPSPSPPRRRRQPPCSCGAFVASKRVPQGDTKALTALRPRLRGRARL